ncbi:MAG TPA: hypothetical protein VMW19_10400 [Myxococcota bacterium]|nr:hypothetical protein [Myxococcota bacterium]
MRPGRRARRAASVALLCGLAAWLQAPALRCLQGCYFDYAAIRASDLGRLEPSDARLNTWILAWVQRSLLHDPGALFDGNIFYPAQRVITQSEHLVAEALLTLPVRAFGGDAVASHQAAILLSGLLLALTTFALVCWLTGSEFAAFAAGAASLSMPWRVAELSHVQILSAQWIPLVWLQMLRIAEGERARRQIALLALALALALLSSFYLAYYLVASCALLALASILVGALDRRGALALAIGAAPATLLFVALALPYLEWGHKVGFQGPRPIESVAPLDALALIAPRLELGWRGVLPVGVSLEVPLAVFAAGCVALAAGWRGFPGEAGRRVHASVIGLGALVAVAFVFALGRELDLGGHPLPLPGELASRLVPGYENLRNPLRWAVPIGVAFPVLAGIGIARLERALATGAARAALRAGVVAAFAASVPWTVLPVRDAWQGQAGRLEAYRQLSALPPGVVIEIPWPLSSARSVDLVSQYVLASTLHWRPLVDGVSGYVPPSAQLVRQVAQRLPAPRALMRLHDLTNVRFVVLHLDLLPPGERPAWDEAVASGRLERVGSGDSMWILELPDFERAPRYLEALRSPETRARTLTGLSRAPLELQPGDGALAVEEPEPFLFAPGATRLVRLALENRSDLPWAGFDSQPEGLVVARYAFRGEDGRDIVSGTAALAEDVPSGSRVGVAVPVRPPAEPGRYRLSLELVQSQGGEERALPLAPVELDVEVRKLAPRPAQSPSA